LQRPPRVIEPAAGRLFGRCRRQPEIFAMRVAHNPRSCRLLQRKFLRCRYVCQNPLPPMRERARRMRCFCINPSNRVLAGAPGLEPGSAASKADALPLRDALPVCGESEPRRFTRRESPQGLSRNPLLTSRFDRDSSVFRPDAITRLAKEAVRLGSAGGSRTRDLPLDRRVL
jgi:hypothetical protein